MFKRFHPCPSKRTCILLAACLLGIFLSPTLGQTLVWMDADVGGRRMQTRDVSGGAVQTLIQFQSPPISWGSIPLPEVHFDSVAQRLYFLWDSAFERVDVDGSNRETIITSSIGTFSINAQLSRIYWVEGLFDDVLRWSQTDGSLAGTHTYPTCCLSMTLGIGNDLYFGAGGLTNKGIWRADAEGANEQFLHPSGQPGHLAYDPVEQKLYVVTIAGIIRFNTDGSGFQQITSSPDEPELASIAIDHVNRKLYWSDPQLRTIRRADLDGSKLETVIASGNAGNPNFNPRGLAIVFTPPPVPSVSQWGFLILVLCIFIAGVCLIRKRQGVACPVNRLSA